MVYPPGAWPASALTAVQGDMVLATGTARAYKRLAAAAKTRLHRTIAIASPAGAGRTAAMQDAMHAAGAGHDPAAKIRWGLNPRSTVSIAAHPDGTHERYTRVDIVGTPMDGAFLALAAKFGFTREFGAADPNHFIHDGRIATAPVTPAAVLPAKKQVLYTVRPHDTLTKIAALYSDPRNKKTALTVDDLVRWNHIADPSAIRVGQKIRIQ